MLNIVSSNLWAIKKEAKKLARYHFDIQKESDEMLPILKEKLVADISYTQPLSSEEKDKIFEYIGLLPDGNVLCHFDFHPGNIIISSNNPIIIDWMTSCMGCGCADIARRAILLKYGEMPRGNSAVKKIVSIIQNYIYKIYVEEYKKIACVSQQDIDEWELPVSAARLCEWISEKEKNATRSY